VSFIKGAKWRALIPAGAVTTVLALSFLGPLPADASKVNNCGVKGGYAYGGYSFAFHDHGKPCPNRPFPGKGEGLEKFLGGAATTDTDTNTTDTDTKTTVVSSSGSATIEDIDSSTSVGNATSSGKAHAHSKSQGHGKGL
jgi:hypothetical protein